MDGLSAIHQQDKNQFIRKDLPILMISGDADPVGGFSKGIWKVANNYQKIGLDQITVSIYEDGRHEMLHELNKNEVQSDVLEWLNTQLKPTSVVIRHN